MPYVSLNPTTNEVIETFASWSSPRLEQALEETARAQDAWAKTARSRRAPHLSRAAAILRERCGQLASLITLEMGKPRKEALAEIEKCAIGCDYFSANSERFLQDEPIKTDAGKSYVHYAPLGVVLGIMPWNFPFWQVFRYAAPALMAGNGSVLKHAPNVPKCALAIEKVFIDAGFPQHLFTCALMEVPAVADAIASPHVHAVTLTGSEAAGRKVAVMAGRQLKKCVLELGGSDPFVVLADADLEFTAGAAIAARFQNCGQSCIAAKRFILVPEIAEEFVGLFRGKVSALKVGAPDDETTDIGPMARLDLRDALNAQVADSIAAGARPVIGCKPVEGKGFYYQPSILDHVTPSARAYHEELFGPVAVVIRALNEEDALRIANDTRFGLGSSVWSRDAGRAEEFAKRIQAGSGFINSLVKSDPRLPFGGVKASGFGRELSYHGVREFTNAKTIWVR